MRTASSASRPTRDALASGPFCWPARSVDDLPGDRRLIVVRGGSSPVSTGPDGGRRARTTPAMPRGRATHKESALRQARRSRGCHRAATDTKAGPPGDRAGERGGVLVLHSGTEVVTCSKMMGATTLATSARGQVRVLRQAGFEESPKRGFGEVANALEGARRQGGARSQARTWSAQIPRRVGTARVARPRESRSRWAEVPRETPDPHPQERRSPVSYRLQNSGEATVTPH